MSRVALLCLFVCFCRLVFAAVCVRWMFGRSLTLPFSKHMVRLYLCVDFAFLLGAVVWRDLFADDAGIAVFVVVKWFCSAMLVFEILGDLATSSLSLP